MKKDIHVTKTISGHRQKQLDVLSRRTGGTKGGPKHILPDEKSRGHHELRQASGIVKSIKETTDGWRPPCSIFTHNKKHS